MGFRNNKTTVWVTKDTWKKLMKIKTDQKMTFDEIINYLMESQPQAVARAPPVATKKKNHRRQ